MRYVKTYSKDNIIEWMGTLHVGSLTMNVSFTGGSQTAYGVSPATFTTKDEFTQNFIEKSEEFKAGRIQLYRQAEISEESKPSPAPVAAKKVEAIEPAPLDEAENEGDADADASEDGKAIVEVTDIDDARDYLVEEFGIARSTLRSNVSVFRAAEEHNIVFKGIEE